VATSEQEPVSAAPRHLDADEYMREVERACKERGLRLTPLRVDILQLLATSPRPIKAYDLLDQIRASKAKSAPATAYRTLNFLLAQGFIHKIQALNAFVRCHRPSQSQHAWPFLICDRCGQSIELQDDPTGPLLTEMAERLGFRALNQTLEVKGVCAACIACFRDTALSQAPIC